MGRYRRDTLSCTSVMRAYFITQSSGEAGTSTPALCPLLAPLWPAWRDEAWPSSAPSSAGAALGEGQGRGRV